MLHVGGEKKKIPFFFIVIFFCILLQRSFSTLFLCMFCSALLIALIICICLKRYKIHITREYSEIIPSLSQISNNILLKHNVVERSTVFYTIFNTTTRYTTTTMDGTTHSSTLLFHIFGRFTVE